MKFTDILRIITVLITFSYDAEMKGSPRSLSDDSTGNNSDVSAKVF